jgi:signal transduction histidine kinase
MTALLEERGRIASEIHDGVAQELTTVSIQLDVLEELMNRDPARAGELVSVIRASARAALDLTRSAIVDMTPVVPDRSWLLSGLPQVVEDFSKRWHAEVSFTLDGEAQIVGPNALAVVFAFVQEGLTNLRKHSEIRRGAVAVEFVPEAVCVSVRTPAWGGNGDSLGHPGHGLDIVKGRARLLGGDVQLEQISEGDTEIRLRLPL